MTAIKAPAFWQKPHNQPLLGQLRGRAAKSTNIAPLIVLRLAFGLLMFVSMLRFMARGWIHELYVVPQFHFTYSGFGWITPLPEWGLWLVFISLALLSLSITLGLAYRFSMVAFFLLFTYVELLDKTTYLNHYYFISLLSFLLIFLPLNGAYALDNRLGIAPRRSAVPAWTIWLVRLQIGLVYFFAGLAKINPDWLLHGQPLGIWLHARTAAPLIGPFFDLAWIALAMSWAAMLFDLTIPFWLSWSKSRLPAYIAVVLFHGMTALLFNIGMFPWIMIACTLVFFNWQIKAQEENEEQLANSIRKRTFPRLAGMVLLLFFLAQFILPLRHWLIPGDVNWTEQGGRFAWRVMLAEKTGHVTFFVRQQGGDREWIVLPGDYLTDLQEKQMSFQPDMIMQFADYIGRQYKNPVAVRAEAYVSWNGRSSRLLLDPTVDLLRAAAPPLSDASSP